MGMSRNLSEDEATPMVREFLSVDNSGLQDRKPK